MVDKRAKPGQTGIEIHQSESSIGSDGSSSELTPDEDTNEESG